MSDIFSDALKNKNRCLGEEDLPRLRHDFMTVYGFIPSKVWNDEDIGLMLELWPLVQNEIRKKEQFMINVMAGLSTKSEHIRKWQKG
jgi:hypothetical protein